MLICNSSNRDKKKLDNTPLVVEIEVWQKKWKEYWESNKDVLLGKFQLPLDNLADNQLYDQWLALPKGTLHLSVINVSFNIIYSQLSRLDLFIKYEVVLPFLQ